MVGAQAGRYFLSRSESFYWQAFKRSRALDRVQGEN